MSVRLTEDMICDILERLPSKSLMRFKSVHRSWDALFKTNTFIIKQRQRQKEMKGSNYDERFMTFNTPVYYDLPVNITLLSCNDPTPFREVHYPISHPYQKLCDLSHRGYCNGVFCLEAKFDDVILPSNKFSLYEAIVWNPATREAKVLPDPPPCPDHIHKTMPAHILYGFGATSADDVFFSDLNYIQIFMSCHNPIFSRHGRHLYPHGIYSIAFAQEFNVSSNSWTVINVTDANASGISFDSRYRHDFNDYGIYSNGVCHWLIPFSYVLCFDFRTNKFRKVDTPSPTTTLVVFEDKILESRDSIAYVAYCKRHDFLINYDEMEPIRIEVWILKEEEKDCSSWTKLCTMEALSGPISIHAIWKNDTEFLGSSYSETLVSYNSRAEPLLCFDTFTFGNPLSIYKYMESMIPLSL